MKKISLCKSCVESCYLKRIVTDCKDYWKRLDYKAKRRRKDGNTIKVRRKNN